MKSTQFPVYICSLLACAGTALGSSSTNEIATTAELERPEYRTWTVGAEFGTTGGGLFGLWRFHDHLGVRAGFDFYQYIINDYAIEDVHYDTKARLLSEPLTLNIYPWKKHSFHISVGLMFNQNELTGEASDPRNIVIGGQPYQLIDSTLHVKITQQLVNPYLSIGGNFFYFDHAHRWALAGELGVAFTGEPDVSLTQTGARTDPIIDPVILRAEEAAIKDWASQAFKWFPVVKLAVTYSF